MFKKIIIIIFIVTAILNSAYILAEESERPEWIPNISADVAFETKYIWRGQSVVDDIVIQPGTSVEFYGFTFSIWGDYDTDSGNMTEWDYIFDYTLNIDGIRKKLALAEKNIEFIDPFTISAGYIFYTFPNLSGDASDSHEFYVGLSYDKLFQPFVTYYIDFEEGSGSYWEFGGSYTFEFTQGINAMFGVTSGYNAGQWGYDRSFSNLLFSGEASIPIFKYFTISPNVNYSLALDKQYDSEFYSGVKVNFAY